MAQTTRGVRRQRSAAEPRSPRGQGLGTRAPADPARCADLGLLGIERAGRVRRPRSRQGLVAGRRRAHRPGGRRLPPPFGGQANLCILPLVLFGTDEQKAQIPAASSSPARSIGAYALSESGSGSDALAAKTPRRSSSPTAAGVLNGEKMWISNGGFADLIDRLCARSTASSSPPSSSSARFPASAPARKSTRWACTARRRRRSLFQDVRVPAGNVLGEIGKGHKVALNTLNYGRFSLGGDVRRRLPHVHRRRGQYAAQRRQFGQPIAAFGAIKHKLGEMIARTYAAESLVYRTAGLIDAALDGVVTRRRGTGARRSRSTPSSRPSPRSPAPRCSTTCSTRTCRFMAATASSRTTPPSAITATRA